MAVLEDGEPHDASAPHSAWTALRRLVRAHPNVDLQVVGFSSDDAGATSHVIDLLRLEQPANVDLLEVTLARVFGARLDDLRRFLEVLHDGLPDGTTIYLRGSAVNGQSYETGVVFDGRGAGTSDLDLVAIGDEASKLWVAEARLLGGVNSLPLYDGARWVAPALDPMRMDAQRIAGRPVSLQSMAGWFLELRAVVQGQQYVKLDAAE
jgi:hypothetical protein